MNLIHIWSFLGTPSENDQRRMDVAQGTWGQFDQNIRIDRPSHTTSTMVGDKHPAYRVDDIIYGGMGHAKRQDAIVLSNADIYFMPDAAAAISAAISEHGCCWSRRHDFDHLPIEPQYTIKSGAEYPGADVFGFDLRWASENLKDYPGFFFGRQHWDCCMRLLMRKTGGVHVPDISAHEVHHSQWLSGDCNAANLYNERLLCEWITKNGGSEQDHLYTNVELGFPA